MHALKTHGAPVITMIHTSTLFSRRCCGGPTLALTLFFSFLGVLFVILSATVPGLVLLATGISALGLCMMLGQKRCRRMHPYLHR